MWLHSVPTSASAGLRRSASVGSPDARAHRRLESKYPSDWTVSGIDCLAFLPYPRQMMPSKPSTTATHGAGVVFQKIFCLGKHRRLLAVAAYAAILALLCRIVWGMWNWRDLTYGDTSYFYVQANGWLEKGRFEGDASLVFSPLYSVFYSFFIGKFDSAYLATIFHRLAILLILAPAILFLCRSALPKGVAWLIAAWWVVLPINWNAMFESHLFGLILFVAGCCFAGLRDSTLARATGIACFLAGSLLARNEFLLATALLGTASAVWEFRAWRKLGAPVTALGPRLLVLVAPSIVVILLSALVFHGSFRGLKSLAAKFSGRQRLNISQVYAAGYQQRHPEWTKSPWTDGDELLKRDFGTTEVTFVKLMSTNPKAFWDHVAWNLRLLPSGLQLGMFNCYAGRASPDFVEFKGHRKFATVASIIFCALVVSGIISLRRRKALWSRFLRGRRAWCWVAMAATIAPGMVAIVTQRPRPSYIFMISLFLMMFAGLCLTAVLRHFRANRSFNSMSPLLAIPIILFASPKRDTAQIYSGRPYYQIYERLYPFRGMLANERTVYCAEKAPGEIFMYLGKKMDESRARYLSPALQESTGAALGKFLSDTKINLL